MDDNKFELKITKDINGNTIDINSMSLETVQSFLIMIEAITKIVELNPDKKNITISISAGSAAVAAQGEKINETKKDFNTVIEFNSTNKELFEPWRKLQNLFSANGLQYEANFWVKDEKESVVEIIRNSKLLKAKPVPKHFEASVTFMTGSLIAVGGKIPNIHIENDSNKKERLIISCTKSKAIKAREFLYQNIYFSAWIKESDDNKKIYELCDSYRDNLIFDELKVFIEDLKNLDEIEALNKIHLKCREYLDVQNYGTFRKFLRLFIHENTDVNILKELLLTTQSLKDHERITEMRMNLKAIFDKKMKFYKNQNKRVSG